MSIPRISGKFSEARNSPSKKMARNSQFLFPDFFSVCFLYHWGLRPVTYQFDVNRFDGNDPNIQMVEYTRALALRRTGFIAQEVEAAAKHSQYEFSGINRPESEQDHYGLSYESFVVPLVKAVQEQQDMIADLQHQLSENNKKLAEQKQSNSELIKAISDMRDELNNIRSKIK